MSVTRINVNNLQLVGVSPIRKIIDTRNTNRIHTFVSLLNDREPVEQKIQKWAGEVNENLYYGTRCKDITSIVDRITSALAHHAVNSFDSELIAEMWINAQVEQMSGRELATLADISIKDCASSDHYYTFEKQY